MAECNTGCGYSDRISLLEERMTRTEKLTDRLRKEVEEITTNNAVQNNKLDTISSILEDIKIDIAELKEKPVKRWDTAVSAVIAAISSGLAGALLGVLLKG